MHNMEKQQRNEKVKQRFQRMDSIQGKELNERAYAAGMTLVKDDNLKTHQLRNIYSAIEKIRTQYQRSHNRVLNSDSLSFFEELEMQLILIKPKLAYAAGRQKSVRDHLYPFLENAIDATLEAEGPEGKQKAFKNFFALIESVVGYHKYFENTGDQRINP